MKDDEDPEIVREAATVSSIAADRCCATQVMPTIGNKLAEENRKHGGCWLPQLSCPGMWAEVCKEYAILGLGLGPGADPRKERAPCRARSRV